MRSSRSYALAVVRVEGEQKEACHKLDELAGKIAHDAGPKATLTAAQGALLSGRVVAVDAELGC